MLHIKHITHFKMKFHGAVHTRFINPYLVRIKKFTPYCITEYINNNLLHTFKKRCNVLLIGTGTT